MRTIFQGIRPLVLALTSFAASTLAQGVTIPDPGLDVAIREALHKPVGPLTEQDMLGLTNLDASRRNVSNPAGLETARNLVSLNLQINQLTNFSLANTLTNLAVLDLSFNSLKNCSFPGGLMKLDTLILQSNQLNNLTFPAGPTRLNSLDLSH